MTKTILLMLTIFFATNLSSQTCSELPDGVFQNDSEYGKSIMERQGNFQLEKSIDYGTIYLNKIEKISCCEYKVKIYKVIKNGILPVPSINDVLKVCIYKVENGIYYYRFNLIGTKIEAEGKLTKISNEISEEFKQVLKKEE